MVERATQGRVTVGRTLIGSRWCKTWVKTRNVFKERPEAVRLVLEEAKTGEQGA